MLIIQAAVPRSEMREVIRVLTARGCRRCAGDCGVDAWVYRRFRDAGTRSVSYIRFYAESHPLFLKCTAGAIDLALRPAYMYWRVTGGLGQRSGAFGTRPICVEAIKSDGHCAGLYKLEKGWVLDNRGHRQNGQRFHLQRGTDRP